MEDFNDYYAILGISREANDKEIKKAYLDKCFIFHPDRLQGAPDSAKKHAEQELIRVNRAYEVLKDTRKRQAFDKEWLSHKNKPIPVVEPTRIKIKNVKPGEIKLASFTIRNIGGPYSKISIPNPDTWVRLTKWQSLSNTDELPLEVNVEVEGPNTGTKFNETIKIRLDNEEAQLPVTMQMQNIGRNLLDRMFKGNKGDTKNKGEKKGHYRIPNSVMALLFISPLSLIGLGISYLLDNFILLWLILGFSIIFSIQKWLYYYTKKYKFVGKIYRLFLNLSILSLLGLTTWYGIQLFSRRLPYSPLIGSFLFLIEIILFIWLWRVVASNSWRWPSLKLTIFTIIVLFFVLAFAGVQPMAGYKDSVINSISSTFSSSQNTNPGESNNVITPIPTSTHISIPTNIKLSQSTITVIPPKTGTTTPKTTGINASTGVYKNYYLGLVDEPEGTIGSNGCYDDTGKFIVLINNKNAVNPTYDQLLSFLSQDNTDQYPYTYQMPILKSYYGTAESRVDLQRIKDIIDGVTQPSIPCICADFAERLHNNAEIAGIRCAYVSLDMTGYDDPYNYGIAPDASHACNAFQTTDRGLIYIDCTGGTTDYGPSSNDTTVDIQIGKEYIPHFIFPSGGWTIDSMGTVTGIYMTWDGNWHN